MSTVTNLTDYGCFAEIEEGVEGLVHVSEMDWTNKNIHPSKVVTAGDTVEVMVLDIDEERRRISLGIKQCRPNPWEEFAVNHKKGERVTGRIKSITDFGIFIGPRGDIDGLVHLSDVSWKESGETAVRRYSKGEEIETVILSIDPARERISLGIKQLDEDAFTDYVAANERGSIVKGVVVALEPKEAELKLAEDVIGILKASGDRFRPGGGCAQGVVRRPGNRGEDRQHRPQEPRHRPVCQGQQIDEERMAVKEHRKQEGTRAGSSTLGDLIKAQMGNRQRDGKAAGDDRRDRQNDDE